MTWWSDLPKNLKVAKAFAGRAMLTPTGGSYARWMTVGAGLGAIRGMMDNVVGEDRVSVLGGAIQGAMLGAGARGVSQLWSLRNARVASQRLASGGKGWGFNPRPGWGPGGVIYGQAPKEMLALPNKSAMVTPAPARQLMLPGPMGSRGSRAARVGRRYRAPTRAERATLE